MKLNHRFPARPDDAAYEGVYWDEEVAGVQYRIGNAVEFASGSERRLEFVLDPFNPHDHDAIRVYGTCVRADGTPRRVHLGYVARGLARRLQGRGMARHAVPVLRNIWWGGYHRNVIYIRYDVVFPTRKALAESRPHENAVCPDEPEPFDFGIAEGARPKPGLLDRVFGGFRWLTRSSARTVRKGWRITRACARRGHDVLKPAVRKGWTAGYASASRAGRRGAEFTADLYRDLRHYDEREPSTAGLLGRLIGFTVVTTLLVAVAVQVILVALGR